MALLSKVEQAYMADKEQFSKTKQRYIRYRINKKLRLLNVVESSILLGSKSRSSCAAAAFRDAAMVGWDSLVRIPQQTGGLSLEASKGYGSEDKKIVGWVGFEPTIPAMSRRHSNNI